MLETRTTAMTSQREGRELDRIRASRDELTERIVRAVPDDRTFTPWDGLRLRRVSAPTEVGHGVTTLAFCVIAQGSRRSGWATGATSTTPPIT